MSEFDEKLNTLLSNPESMAQIMQLAKSLSGQEEAGQTAENSPPKPTPPSQSAPPPPQDGGAPGFDPKLIAQFAPLFKELNNAQNGQARQLLYALRPYLSTQRQEKVERALQLARLIHVGKKFLADWEG